MISVNPFEPWHADAIKNVISEVENIEQHKAFIRGFKKSEDRHAVTISHCRDPIAIIGGVFRYPQVMEVFALLGEEITRHPIGFHKQVRRIINTYFSECELNRMQMEVRADHKRAVEWAVSLGFKPEGVMKKYGLDGSDYYLFARCK